MRPRATLITSVVILIAWAAHAAGQSNYSIHATATSDQGWTSNNNNAPNDDDLTTPTPQSGFFGNLRPGVLFTFQTPRSSHEVQYLLSYTYFLSADGGNTLSHSLSWGGQFQPTPRTNLNLNTSFAIGQTSPIVIEAQLAEPGFQPPGATDFRQLQLGEAFEYQVTPFWRARQSFGLATVTSEPATTNVETSASTYTIQVGADYQFPRSSFGLQARVALITLTSEQPAMDEPRVDQDQLNQALEAVCQLEIAPRWRGDLTLGIIRTSPLGDELESALNPSGIVGVNYAPDWGNARLSYGRAVGVDLFLAQNTANDTVALNAWMPAWRFETSALLAGAALTYGRFESIDLRQGETQSAFDAYAGGASLTWTPDEAPFGGIFSYTYQRQDSAPMLPQSLPEFTRHSITLSVFGRLPYRRAGELLDLEGQRARSSGSDRDAPDTDQQRRNQRPGL